MQFSICIVCDRYLQRLNLVLRNWIHQDFRGHFEILVSSSLEDDGVRNYLENLAGAYPEVKLSTVEVPQLSTKAEYQLRLVERAQGRILIFADADMVFPIDFLSRIAAMELNDGTCLWIGRAYLSRDQTYRALLGDLRLDDPELFRRPLRGEFEACTIYEKGPSGSCHVYTRKTFLDGGGYEGVEVKGGRYGIFASRFLKKAEAMGVIHTFRKFDDICALHLWHGADDSRINHDGSPVLW